MYYVLLFKGNNCYANAPQYYAILTLTVWFIKLRTQQLIHSF